jgi:hypothetical protein
MYVLVACMCCLTVCVYIHHSLSYYREVSEGSPVDQHPSQLVSCYTSLSSCQTFLFIEMRESNMRFGVANIGCKGCEGKELNAIICLLRDISSLKVPC